MDSSQLILPFRTRCWGWRNHRFTNISRWKFYFCALLRETRQKHNWNETRADSKLYDFPRYATTPFTVEKWIIVNLNLFFSNLRKAGWCRFATQYHTISSPIQLYIPDLLTYYFWIENRRNLLTEATIDYRYNGFSCKTKSVFYLYLGKCHFQTHLPKKFKM